MPKRVLETGKWNLIPLKIQHLLKEFEEIVADNDSTFVERI